MPQARRQFLRDYDLAAIEAYYPRLIRVMKWCAILSTSEAAAAIREHKAGSLWAGEAVNHYGGTRKVIKNAIAWRNVPHIRTAIRGIIPTEFTDDNAT